MVRLGLKGLMSSLSRDIPADYLGHYKKTTKDHLTQQRPKNMEWTDTVSDELRCTSLDVHGRHLTQNCLQLRHCTRRNNSQHNPTSHENVHHLKHWKDSANKKRSMNRLVPGWANMLWQRKANMHEKYCSQAVCCSSISRGWLVKMCQQVDAASGP